MTRLSEKVAVVTGAATGIGQGIALSLAREGARVVAVYHRSPPDETLGMIQAVGGRAIAIPADCSDRSCIKRLFEQTRDVFGPVIDILVNNAALQTNHWLLEYPLQYYDMLMQVNLMGYWRCIQEVLPYMKTSRAGRIINISSIHATRPTAFDPVYGMTKGGVKMLTREAALALGKYNITVNALNLGAVKIRGKSMGFPWKASAKKWSSAKRPVSGFLSGRVGMPEDAGYLVCFLAAEESQFITGSSLRADGGAMML